MGCSELQGQAMRRREFIALGVAAVARPIGVCAQALPVVGFLGSDSPELYTARLRALRRGLKDAGFIESENVAIEYRWANGDNNRLPALATELVNLRAAVLVSSTTPTTLALKAATSSIPIVFFIAGDPIALGLVRKLEPTRRQHHGHYGTDVRGREKMAAALTRDGALSDELRRAYQPD